MSKRRTAEVDGQTAIIDGTAPPAEPIFKRPTVDEAIKDLADAFVTHDEAKAAHADTTEALTAAKKLVENKARYVVELQRDDAQLTLGSDPETIGNNLRALAENEPAPG